MRGGAPTQVKMGQGGACKMQFSEGQWKYACKI
jgi:hypothetical protein